MSEQPKKRRTRPKVVRLKLPKGDGPMADTLLFLLNYVRSGKIKAYSICIVGERTDGTGFSIESATADGDPVRELELLGCMRHAEHGLIQRREERLEREGLA